MEYGQTAWQNPVHEFNLPRYTQTHTVGAPLQPCLAGVQRAPLMESTAAFDDELALRAQSDSCARARPVRPLCPSSSPESLPSSLSLPEPGPPLLLPPFSG